MPDPEADDLGPVLREALAKTERLVRPRYASTDMIRKAIEAGGKRLVKVVHEELQKAGGEWAVEFVSCPPLVVHIQIEGHGAECGVAKSADEQWDKFAVLFTDAPPLSGWVRDAIAAGPRIGKHRLLEKAPLVEFQNGTDGTGWAAAFPGIASGDQQVLVGLMRATCSNGDSPSSDYVRDCLGVAMRTMGEWVRIQHCQLGSGWQCLLLPQMVDEPALADPSAEVLAPDLAEEARPVASTVASPTVSDPKTSPQIDQAETFDLDTDAGRRHLFNALVARQEFDRGTAEEWRTHPRGSEMRYLYCGPTESSVVVVIRRAAGIDEGELTAELLKCFPMRDPATTIQVIYPRRFRGDVQALKQSAESTAEAFNKRLAEKRLGLPSSRRFQKVSVLVKESSCDWTLS